MTWSWVGRPLAAVLLAVVIGCVDFEGGGAGPEPAFAQTGNNVALDTAIVENFIRTYPAMRQAAEEIAARYNIDTGGDPAGFGALMSAADAWGELNGIASANGYADFSAWLATTVSIATAYGFVESGAAMDQGMAEALDAIRNDPNLTDEQKAAMLAQLQQSMGAVAAASPPESNLEAVRPYLAELKALFEG